MNIQELVQEFKKQNPIGNVQDFVAGLEAREDETQSLFFIINNVISALDGRDDSIKEWIEEQIEEHKESFDTESE